MTKRILFAAALAALAVTGLASSASARWWGDGHWHNDDRWSDYDHDYDHDHDHHHHRFYGYHYRAPPVVYGTPYNYGYAPPPVVYGAEPGVNFNFHVGP